MKNQKQVPKIFQGDIVRGFRTMCGMKRTDLADRIGVTVHALGSWENNRTEMRVSVVKDIMEIFGPYGDLFWECLKHSENHSENY